MIDGLLNSIGIGVIFLTSEPVKWSDLILPNAPRTTPTSSNPLPDSSEVVILNISPSICTYEPSGNLNAVPIPAFGTWTFITEPVVRSSVNVSVSLL